VKVGDLVRNKAFPPMGCGKISVIQVWGMIIAIKKMKYVGPVAIVITKRGIEKIRLENLEVDGETGGSGTCKSRKRR